MYRVALAAISFILIVCSCASRPVSDADDLYVYLTDSARYTLLPPADIARPIDMAQHISASFQGQEYAFNAWVQANETEMGISLFNELGAAMGELSYRNGAVHFSSPAFPASLKPAYIVADFQLCFYNPVRIDQALKACGLTLEIDGAWRRISRGNTIIIEIEQTPGMVTLVNHARGYRYVLEGTFL